MQISLRWRDYSPMPDPSPFPGLALKSYSWAAKGGPKRCLLSGDPDPDLDYSKLLRCYLEIKNDESKARWWGMIRKIIVPHGTGALIYSLDRLYNSVVVTYANIAAGNTKPTGRGFSVSATDPVSIAEFGVFELRASMRQATSAAAEKRRDVLLSLHHRPSMTPDDIQVQGLEVECCGLWDMLINRYYANSGTDLVSVTDQIIAIITAYGQFFSGVTVINASTEAINEFRDGDDTCQKAIEDLLGIGTSSGQVLTASVTNDRRLEITVRPEVTDIEYYYTPEGDLETASEVPVPQGDCVVNAWAVLKDVPMVLGGQGMASVRYISEAEYNDLTGKTTYRWDDIPSAYNLLEVGR